MGFAAVVALVVLRASLLALSSNQWTTMQTLTDAYLSRETALSNRVPMADITASPSDWPLQEDAAPRTISLGKVAGGNTINGTLTRFRVNQAPVTNAVTGLAVWRLHSVLSYKVDGKKYVKSCSTLRMQ